MESLRRSHVWFVATLLGTALLVSSPLPMAGAEHANGLVVLANETHEENGWVAYKIRTPGSKAVVDILGLGFQTNHVASIVLYKEDATFRRSSMSLPGSGVSVGFGGAPNHDQEIVAPCAANEPVPDPETEVCSSSLNYHKHLWMELTPDEPRTYHAVVAWSGPALWTIFVAGGEGVEVLGRTEGSGSYHFQVHQFDDGIRLGAGAGLAPAGLVHVGTGDVGLGAFTKKTLHAKNNLIYFFGSQGSTSLNHPAIANLSVIRPDGNRVPCPCLHSLDIVGPHPGGPGRYQFRVDGVGVQTHLVAVDAELPR